MTTKSPIASIVIVHYGSYDDLRRCITSIDAFTKDAEVIVVDNDQLSSEFSQTVPHVRLIRAGGNKGFGFACNLGASFAKSSVLVFMNNDIEVEAGWLEPLLAALTGRLVACACPVVVLRNERAVVNSAGGDCDFMALAWNKGLGHHRNSNWAKSFFYAPGSCLAIRKEAFHKIGGFDESLFLFLEDVDLSWRLRLAGWELALVPNSVVLHEWMASTSELNSFDIQYLFNRNRLRLILKNYSYPKLVHIFAVYLGLQLGLVLWIVSRKESQELRAVVAAWRWNLRNLSNTMKARQRTQASRKKSDVEIMHTMYRGVAGVHLALRTMEHPVFERYFGRSKNRQLPRTRI